MSTDKLETSPPLAVVAKNPPSIQGRTTPKDDYHVASDSAQAGMAQGGLDNSRSAGHETDAELTKYKHYAASFTAIVVIGTFAATLIVSTLSLMVTLLGGAVYGRIFRVMFVAGVLSMGACILAGVNAVLCSLLAAGGTLRTSRQLKILYNPNASLIICAIFMMATILCYIMGGMFAIQKYDPHLGVPLVVLVVIAVCCSILPAAAGFIVSIQLLQFN